MSESYDLTVQPTPEGNWEALTKDTPPFAVEGKTPGHAVEGMINILKYWESLEDTDE